MLMPTRTPKPFRDPTKLQLARRGVVFVLVIVIVLVLLQLHRAGTFGGAPQVTAQLRNAGGSLVKNSDVKVDGVIVGHVTAIEAGPDNGVDVKMVIDKGQFGHVPSSVVARILPATVFGTSYVDLRIAGAASHALAAGAIIPADTSQGTLELQDALDDIDSLVKALDPAKLATALGAISVALDGRGTAIGQAAVSLDDYLKKFRPELATLKADLGKLSTFLQTVRHVAPQLLDATDHGLDLLDVLVQHQQDLDDVLTGGTALADTTTAALAKNTQGLASFLADASKLIDALYDNRTLAITDVVKIHSTIGSIVQAAAKQGYIKVDGPLTLGVPGYYGSGK